MIQIKRNKIKLLGLTALAVASYGFAGIAQSQVKSQSADEFVQYGPEDAYWVFTVTCADDAERQVQRKTDGDLWCAKDVEGFCDLNREIAAEKSCSKEYTEATTATAASDQQASEEKQRSDDAEAEKAAQLKRQQEQERERQAQRARANAAAEAKREEEAKKQILIQEELLKIEQEKLNLRRQELELQQRAVEIEELLEKSE